MTNVVERLWPGSLLFFQVQTNCGLANDNKTVEEQFILHQKYLSKIQNNYRYIFKDSENELKVLQEFIFI